MSDSGVPALTSLKISNPVLSDVAAFIGEMARPIAILMVAFGAMVSSIIMAFKITGDGAGAALLAGAIMGGLASLYLGKAWEKVAQIRQGGTP